MVAMVGGFCLMTVLVTLMILFGDGNGGGAREL